MLVQVKSGQIIVNDQVLVSIPQWELERGKVYGVTGVTGSGKSTIGKWLAQVEPVYWKVSGRVQKPEVQSYETNDPSGESPLYLLQDAYKIFNPYVSILTHFRDLWRSHAAFSALRNFEEVFEILTEVGVKNPEVLVRYRVHQISQGEAQRCAFVLGLIRSASLRIYDEVFSNVDLEASRKMLGFLHRFCKRTHTSVLVISHETELIRDYANELFAITDRQLHRMVLPARAFAPETIPGNFLPLLSMTAVRVPGYGKRSGRKKWLSTLAAFDIGQGEVVGIHGVSGVGKTTFLKGLLGEHPLPRESCHITTWDGGSTTDLRGLDIRYLPQSVASSFNPAVPLRVSIREIQAVRKVSDEEVALLMAKFGLDPGFLDRFADELSGGEIQRMGIIATLLGSPDLLLLDESFSSLDYETRVSIWDVLRQEQKSYFFSLLVVSHDTSWLGQIANRVYELEGYG